MTLHLAQDAAHEPSPHQDPLVASLLQENERLQAQLNAQNRNVELFHSIFRSLPDGLAIADQDRVIQTANPGLTELFGYTLDEMVGRKTAMLYESEEEFKIQGRARFNLTAQEQLAPYQVRYRKKDGSIFIGETIGTPLRDSRGLLLGYLGAIRDVTEREQTHLKLTANESLLNLITNSVPELVNYVCEDHTLRFVNATTEAWYCRPREHLIGQRFEDVLGPEASKTVQPWVDAALKGVKVKKRAQITYPDGVPRAVDVSYVPDINQFGRVVGFVALVVDVSHQQKIEQKLKASETRLTDAISAIPDGFAYYDSDDRLQVFNEQYRSIYAKSAEAIVRGNTFEDVLRAGIENGQYEQAFGREEEWITQRLEAHQNPGDPIEQCLDDGRWLRIEERKTRDGGTVGIRVDITEAKRREIELERLSVTDALTALSNRRAFLDRIAQEHERICRYGGVMSVLLIDVDHFKRINDTHGHLTGDIVLKELAAVLGHELRDPDVVCRYGGEEFAAFLPETSVGGGFSTAERVREAVESREFCSGNPVVDVTVSIGVTQCDHRDRRYENALIRADKALYEAKHSGRNRVMISPPEADV